MEERGEASKASEATTQRKSALEILLGDISSKLSVHTPEDELKSFIKNHKGLILTH